MNAKEIGRKAGRIFGYHLPDHWIFRSQEDQEDYGVDGEVEIADSSDHATGFIFKAQIKGQKSVSIINNSQFISFSLSVERLKYYMRQVEIPIVLIVVDTTKEQVFWKSLQDDTELNGTLQTAIESKQTTVSVHIPTANTLPEKSTELLEAVETNMNWLRVSALNRMTTPIQNLVKNSPNDLLAEMLEKSKTLNFHVYSESFERLYVEGRFAELFNSARDVTNSATEKVETRFCAGLYIELLYLQEADYKSEKYQMLCVDLYIHLLQIVREGKGSGHLRLFALLLLRSIKLKISVETDYHYYISAKMSENDVMTKWVVDFSRSQVILRAARDVEKTIHLINRIILSGNKFILLDVLPRVSLWISAFANRLSLEGYTEQANYLYSWLNFCFDLAIDLSRESKQENIFANILIPYASFKISTDEAKNYLDELFDLANEIKDESLKCSIKDTISKMRLIQNREENDLSPEAELEFFRKRAKSLGFNVDDPEDEMGRIILQGLKDFNPERVLKDCEHLFVFPSSAQGIPAKMVGLSSAALKWVYCLEKGHAIGGWSLDNIYIPPISGDGFKTQYCKDCEHKSPRDSEWKWSSKWQNAQDEKHRDIIIKIDSI